MKYTAEVEKMCPINKGAKHEPAPIPEEGKWVHAKQIEDISGFTHGVGWCAPQQGACKLSLNVKNGIIEEALVETIGCSGMTHSAAMAAEILQGKTILNTEHNALSALSLVAVKIGRSSGDTQVGAVLAHDFLNLVEDEIGILQRSLHIEGYLAAEALAYLRLRQVSHHGGSILMSVGHLVQIYENAGIAMIELHALWEEHRGIAMGIEC